jgi:hypothetical protein
MMGRPVALADGGGLTFTLSAKGTAAWARGGRGSRQEKGQHRARGSQELRSAGDRVRGPGRWSRSGLHRSLGITTLTVTRLPSLPSALHSPGKLAQSAVQSHQLPAQADERARRLQLPVGAATLPRQWRSGELSLWLRLRLLSYRSAARRICGALLPLGIVLAAVPSGASGQQKCQIDEAQRLFGQHPQPTATVETLLRACVAARSTDYCIYMLRGHGARRRDRGARSPCAKP